MDDKSRELIRIREALKQELALGRRIDPTPWITRYPELASEIGKLIAELLVAQASGIEIETVGASSNLVDLSADPFGTTALANPNSPSQPSVDPLMPTLAMTPAPAINPADSRQETLRVGPPPAGGDELEATIYHDPNARPAGDLQPGQKVRYIGDYELGAILGRGGMGVVYRAKQMSLNQRPVALKMIHNSKFASEDQLRRFTNEANAVAALDHWGIVPIYEVGSFEDQRYFSMKLIEGQSMDKALADLKADPKKAARIVAEVADAIHHAHQRGILHRDLKPHNILLDYQEHAHVTDFGLAKKIEGDEGMTESGAVLGTPAYMSPEQALGQNSGVTISSDVYGIGGVLFAALTERAPFVADSVYLTLERVRHNPPDAPHRLNPDVPRDLEVICLKCLEKNPARRYRTAEEVGDELRRWLNNEPIQGRPVNRAVRLAMWARRKPALAGLTAALILASILGVAGITWQWREALYQRDQARIAQAEEGRQKELALEAEKKAKASEKIALAARAEEQKARLEAEQNAQIAEQQATRNLGTVQDLITIVSVGLDSPNLFEIKKKIIEQALARVDLVAARYDQKTSKEATHLAALSELAKIYRMTGQIDRASATLQKCLIIAKARLIIKNRNSSSRYNLANIYIELAFCAEEHDRNMNLVVENLLEALKLMEDILAHPTDENPALNATAVRKILADIHIRIGSAYHHLGQIGKARGEFRQAYNLESEILAALQDKPASIALLQPPNSSISLTLEAANSALGMADCSVRLGQTKAAEDDFRLALDLIERAARIKPDDKFTRSSFGNYHAIIGNYRFWTGDLEAARRHFVASQGYLAELAKADGQNAYLRREFFASTLRLAKLADVEKNPELTRREYDEAARLARELYGLDQTNDLRKIELMLVLPHVGQADQALVIADRLADGPRVDPELWTYLARTYAQTARVLPPDQSDRAQNLLNKSIDAIRKALDGGFQDRSVLEYEHDLDPIRGREAFKDLLRTLPPLG